VGKEFRVATGQEMFRETKFLKVRESQGIVF